MYIYGRWTQHEGHETGGQTTIGNGAFTEFIYD